MGNLISANQSLQSPSASTKTVKPIINQHRELDLKHLNKWNKLFQKNSHSIAKVNLQLLDQAPQDSQVFSNIARKTAQVSCSKTMSSIYYNFLPVSSENEVSFLISKLKNFHYVNSLTLDLSSVSSCTPQHLKNLSIALASFKNLTSLTIIFPNSIEMTREHFLSLSFAFHRLRSVTHLSVKFSCENRPEVFSPPLGTLLKILGKLTWLKSLSLSQFASDVSFALFFLSSVLKKFSYLESLELDLSGLGLSQSKHLNLDQKKLFNKLFLALKEKPLKHLALNFQDSQIDFPKSDPISQGLAILDLSQLQNFKLNCYLDPTSDVLEKLIPALQKSPLKVLNLDFSKNHSPSSTIFFTLDLQALHSLSHLTLNPGDMLYGVRATGAAIKSLENLNSLNIDFSKQVYTHADIELVDFSADLRSLRKLKHFSLKLLGMTHLTDKGLVTLSNSLQYLTNLSSLNFELAAGIISQRKEASKLFTSFPKLKNLTDLSLNFTADQNLTLEKLHELAEIIENFTLLNSVNLNFGNCQYLRRQKESFEPLFRSLAKLKFMKKIILHLPGSMEDQTTALDHIKHVKDQIIHWNCCLRDSDVFRRRESEFFYYCGHRGYKL